MKRKVLVVKGHRPLEEYPFLELGGSPPVVLLACSLNEQASPRFSIRPKYAGKFVKVAHQHGGLGCSHANMLAMQFSLDQRMGAVWQCWCDQHYGSNMGVFGTSLEECVKYEQFLKGIQLTCNTSYDRLSESLYPVDCTPESLHTLTGKKFRKPFDEEFLVFPNKIASICGCIGRWQLFVVCENSD